MDKRRLVIPELTFEQMIIVFMVLISFIFLSVAFPLISNLYTYQTATPFIHQTCLVAHTLYKIKEYLYNQIIGTANAFDLLIDYGLGTIGLTDFVGIVDPLFYFSEFNFGEMYAQVVTRIYYEMLTGNLQLRDLLMSLTYQSMLELAPTLIILGTVRVTRWSAYYISRRISMKDNLEKFPMVNSLLTVSSEIHSSYFGNVEIKTLNILDNFLKSSQFKREFEEFERKFMDDFSKDIKIIIATRGDYKLGKAFLECTWASPVAIYEIMKKSFENYFEMVGVMNELIKSIENFDIESEIKKDIYASSLNPEEMKILLEDLKRHKRDILAKLKELRELYREYWEFDNLLLKSEIDKKLRELLELARGTDLQKDARITFRRLFINTVYTKYSKIYKGLHELITNENALKFLANQIIRGINLEDIYKLTYVRLLLYSINYVKGKSIKNYIDNTRSLINSIYGLGAKTLDPSSFGNIISNTFTDETNFKSMAITGLDEAMKDIERIIPEIPEEIIKKSIRFGGVTGALLYPEVISIVKDTVKKEINMFMAREFQDEISKIKNNIANNVINQITSNILEDSLELVENEILLRKTLYYSLRNFYKYVTFKQDSLEYSISAIIKEIKELDPEIEIILNKFLSKVNIYTASAIDLLAISKFIEGVEEKSVTKLDIAKKLMKEAIIIREYDFDYILRNLNSIQTILNEMSSYGFSQHEVLEIIKRYHSPKINVGGVKVAYYDIDKDLLKVILPKITGIDTALEDLTEDFERAIKNWLTDIEIYLSEEYKGDVVKIMKNFLATVYKERLSVELKNAEHAHYFTKSYSPLSRIVDGVFLSPNKGESIKTMIDEFISLAIFEEAKRNLQKKGIKLTEENIKSEFSIIYDRIAKKVASLRNKDKESVFKSLVSLYGEQPEAFFKVVSSRFGDEQVNLMIKEAQIMKHSTLSKLKRGVASTIKTLFGFAERQAIDRLITRNPIGLIAYSAFRAWMDFSLVQIINAIPVPKVFVPQFSYRYTAFFKIDNESLPRLLVSYAYTVYYLFGGMYTDPLFGSMNPYPAAKLTIQPIMDIPLNETVKLLFLTPNEYKKENITAYVTKYLLTLRPVARGIPVMGRAVVGFLFPSILTYAPYTPGLLSMAIFGGSIFFSPLREVNTYVRVLHLRCYYNNSGVVGWYTDEECYNMTLKKFKKYKVYIEYLDIQKIKPIDVAFRYSYSVLMDKEISSLSYWGTRSKEIVRMLLGGHPKKTILRAPFYATLGRFFGKGGLGGYYAKAFFRGFTSPSYLIDSAIGMLAASYTKMWNYRIIVPECGISSSDDYYEILSKAFVGSCGSYVSSFALNLYLDEIFYSYTKGLISELKPNLILVCIKEE